LRTIRALRHHALKAHVAGGAKQVGTNFALLEGRHEDSVGAAGEQAGQIGLAQA